MPNENATAIQTEELPLIRASELAQYSFCRRAWWLGTVKRIPSNNQTTLTRGRGIHRHHASQVRIALRWRQASFFCLGWAEFFY
jgi:hypothetical protein